ncbi:uncharacterized protein J3D65DRAFT_230369 [Phyllosticta citribraziliensis]|uniref:Uncharacterized protein n=1 Tax=Phyllosticta citribraziliensis TaxID=989973 RepID=A0ABR1M939_9PEZI
MPKLKQIECSIALPPYHKLLDEIRPGYTDGCVETFVAIPDEPSAFNIHVTSEGFIAPGLAVFVFIDGVYQCMRFRADLIEEHPPYTRREDTEIDFLFRQKEEKIQGERFLGREWRFDKLNIGEHFRERCNGPAY